MRELQILIPVLFCISTLVFADDDIWADDGEFLEDDANATIHFHTAKQRAQEAELTPKERTEAQKNRTDSCGSLNVGNIRHSGNNKVENVVIIKGDVINANNNCRQ